MIGLLVEGMYFMFRLHIPRLFPFAKSKGTFREYDILKTRSGSSGDNAQGGVATDSSGNAYVAGYTRGGLDSNTLAGSANDDEDYFIVKFDSNGNKQ